MASNKIKNIDFEKRWAKFEENYKSLVRDSEKLEKEVLESLKIQEI